jgi:hypothetical protein
MASGSNSKPLPSYDFFIDQTDICLIKFLTKSYDLSSSDSHREWDLDIQFLNFLANDLPKWPSLKKRRFWSIDRMNLAGDSWLVLILDVEGTVFFDSLQAANLVSYIFSSLLDEFQFSVIGANMFYRVKFPPKQPEKPENKPEAILEEFNADLESRDLKPIHKLLLWEDITELYGFRVEDDTKVI